MSLEFLANQMTGLVEEVLLNQIAKRKKEGFESGDQKPKANTPEGDVM